MPSVFQNMITKLGFVIDTFIIRSIKCTIHRNVILYYNEGLLNRNKCCFTLPFSHPLFLFHCSVELTQLFAICIIKKVKTIKIVLINRKRKLFKLKVPSLKKLNKNKAHGKS